MRKTKVLLFAAAALIAVLSGALAGALTLSRPSVGSGSDEPAPTSTVAPEPSPTIDVSGPCDELEHVDDPACFDEGEDTDEDDDDDDEDGDSSGPGSGGSSGPG